MACCGALNLHVISAQNVQAIGSTNNKTILNKPWRAGWIALPNDPGKGYGVYHFRKNIDLITKPDSFIVKVSADNRYKLYVNGTLVSAGPARGDTYYWNYETIDLAPYLTKGKNIIAAIVWNEAEFRPEAQISLRTGFILQGNSPAEMILNTDRSWRCFQNKAYSPLVGIGYMTYYVAGPGELVDMNKSVRNWMAADFDDTSWLNAEVIALGKLKGTPDAAGWMLVPSSIPQMERTQQRIPVVRKIEGVSLPSTSFPAVRTAITIPAHTTATFLLDQTYLTNAYLTLNFSQGKDAGISIAYAESLFDDLRKAEKGNRNNIEGKTFAGRQDSIISDGTSVQSFQTLYWRTYRYIRLKVQTREDALIIDDIYGTFTGYPFQLNSKVQTDNAEMQKILDIGWRTARLDALETYMDCPYYEQLQYIGDTRIQAMVSYYNSGDERLALNAINQMDHSRIAEGLTLSRHPSSTPQIIPTFSLSYIAVLYDYWMYRPDAGLVKDKLPGARSVLDFFSKYQQADGSLRDVPYWNFVDWVKDRNWKQGMPPKGKNGGSAILDLQLLLAYQMAAAMESKIGIASFAKIYQQKTVQLKKTIRNRYWDASKGLYADTENKELFSQHANSLAILAGLGNAAEQLAISRKLLDDSSLTPCTIYFKYYLHQALIKSGLGNDYMHWLDIWRDNIANGLTTWAETSDLQHSRSDCHAWGASPNIEIYRTILGIDSYAPGFRKVKIEPHVNNIQGDISGEIPHPNGKISVDYHHHNGRQQIEIVLPRNISGVFIWKKKSYLLQQGRNEFKFQ